MFKSFSPNLELSAVDTMYPSRLICVEKEFKSETSSSHFYGFVLEGSAQVQMQTNKQDQGAELPTQTLKKNMYFSTPGPIEIKAQGKVVVFERFGYRGLRQFGGPIESHGRQAYINNCSSTILASPARSGDSVLNFLMFPESVEQSSHSHPSIRLGVVIEGKGEAVFPGKPSVPLSPHSVFLLREHEVHSFNTKDSTLKIIAFHPDSDTGPTDHDNPMLNRTYLVKKL